MGTSRNGPPCCRVKLAPALSRFRPGAANRVLEAGARHKGEPARLQCSHDRSRELRPRRVERKDRREAKRGYRQRIAGADERAHPPSIAMALGKRNATWS